MERVTKIKTADGVLHDSVESATRHADIRYGEALSALAHKIVRLEKYSAICEYIDRNLGMFIELQALRDDMKPPPDNPE